MSSAAASALIACVAVVMKYAAERWSRRRAHRAEQRAREVRAVTVTLLVDTTRFVEGMRGVRRAMVEMIRDNAIAELGRHMQVILARLEVSSFVHGALDPAYAAPTDRDAQVQRMLRDGMPPSCAAEFLRGWVEHR